MNIARFFLLGYGGEPHHRRLLLLPLLLLHLLPPPSRSVFQPTLDSAVVSLLSPELHVRVH